MKSTAQEKNMCCVGRIQKIATGKMTPIRSIMNGEAGC